MVERKTNFISKWSYYLRSIPTILLGVRNWHTAVGLLIGMRTDDHAIIELKDGARFKVRNFMDLWVLKETYLDRDYERKGTPIRDNWTIIDVGAGLGDFSISVARKYPNCQIYSFEPFPESFKLLEENLGLNQITNVRTFPIAVNSTSDPMYLDTSTGVPVRHRAASSPKRDDVQRQQVDASSLQDVFEDLKLSHCDFLKVDCEGCEFDIFLNSSSETINRNSHICLEYHDGSGGHSYHELIANLENLGFTVNVHPNPVHKHLGFLYAHK